MTEDLDHTRRRVFISSSNHNRQIAEQLQQALSRLDITTTNPNLQFGAQIRESVENAIRASDFLVAFLSRESVVDPSVIHEISEAMRRHTVEVVPVITESSFELPEALRALQAVDVSAVTDGVQEVVKRISTTSNIKWSKFSGSDFENLVADLLSRLGYAIRREHETDEGGFDLEATLIEPIGVTHRYYVEVKLYSQGRISPDTIRRFAEGFALIPSEARALLVTNAALTSVANKVAEEYYDWIHVVDAPRLNDLLARFPDLLERYQSLEPGAR